MNAETPIKYAYFRKRRRRALKAQQERAKLRGYDPDRWITEGVGGTTIHTLVGDGEASAILRPGNWLGVDALEMLADRKRHKGDRAPRKVLREVTDKLRKIGVVVEEFETGRNSLDPDHWHEMYADAVDALAGDKRQKAGPGAPKKHVYSSDDLQLISATWNRKDLKNPKERATAVACLEDAEGNKRFPLFKVSTWYTLKREKLV
jgi:hypothetical protein